MRKLDSGVDALLSRVIFTRRKLDVGVVCLLRSPTSLAFIRPPVPPGVRVGRPRVGFILRRAPPCLFATPLGATPNTHRNELLLGFKVRKHSFGYANSHACNSTCTVPVPEENAAFWHSCSLSSSALPTCLQICSMYLGDHAALQCYQLSSFTPAPAKARRVRLRRIVKVPRRTSWNMASVAHTANSPSCRLLTTYSAVRKMATFAA